MDKGSKGQRKMEDSGYFLQWKDRAWIRTK